MQHSLTPVAHTKAAPRAFPADQAQPAILLRTTEAAMCLANAPALLTVPPLSLSIRPAIVRFQHTNAARGLLPHKLDRSLCARRLAHAEVLVQALLALGLVDARADGADGTPRPRPGAGVPGG